MYQILLDRFGQRAAYWGTMAAYALLLGLVALSFSAPAAEFRYGHL
ncbi:hypothetical protein [Novosphingobium sp.]|nr:hypothetical protein [Novosphingobium sp.]MCC6924796.1 hypothetical protein [Novosphingobium sp.]